MKNIAYLPNLPNTITIARIALAPVLILLLKDEDYIAALAVFLIAGLSDALDGYIAKHYNLASRLGAILDPLADKVLLVSAYIMLSMLGPVPFWLVLSVVFRDLLIVSGYLIYTSMVGPVQMRPSYLSKLNTFMQILLIVAILIQLAFSVFYPVFTDVLIYAVLVTTVASGAHYIWAWGVMKDIEVVSQDTRRE